MSFKQLFYLQLTLLLGVAVSVKGQNVPNDVNLKEITVEATRMGLPLKDIPQKVELIDSARVKAIQSDNLALVLKRNTNLDIIEYPGALAAVGMRGFAPSTTRSYTLVLIDGKPSGTNNLATVPIDFIDHVEIVKGPYSVLYGSDAMGGVINIITKQPTKQPCGNVGFSGGGFGQTLFSGFVSGEITRNLSISLGYSRTEQRSDYRIGSSNFLKLSDTEKKILDKRSFGDIMNNSKYQINQFNSNLTYLINNKWSVDLFSILTASNDIELPGNYWNSYGLSKKDINRFGNFLNILYKEQNNDLLISPYYSIERNANYDNNTDSAFINSKNNTKQYGIRVGNTHTWGDLKWLAGADYDVYASTSTRYSSKITEINPYLPDNSRQTLSPFTQIAYSKGNLFVNAGIRYNFIAYILSKNEFLKNDANTTYYSNINPSLGLKYRLSNHANVHASIGNAFYAPDVYKRAGEYMIGNDLYLGNQELKPEAVTSYEIGMNYGLGDRLNVDATYFQGFYKNRIVADYSRMDTTSYKNAMDGMMNGIELMLSSNIARLWNAPYQLVLQGGMTYFFNNYYKDQDFKTNDIIKRDALYVRRTTANLGISFNNNNGFEARFDSRFIGHRLENDWMSGGNIRTDLTPEDYYTGGGYTAADRILRHPQHLIFDLSAHYAITKKAKIGISAANLLDENYTEKDGYNMPGRTMLGHFNYQF